MDFLEDYRKNNITIEELSQKYNISQKRIREVFRSKGIRTKHLKTKKVALKADAIFDAFLQDFLQEGMSIKHYAAKYEVPMSSLTKRLNKYFELRRL